MIDAPDDDDLDLTIKDTLPVPSVYEIPNDPYLAKVERKDKTSSDAVYALMGLLYVIVLGSLGLMTTIVELEIHHIELWIFSLLALIAIVSKPIMSYLSPKDAE